MRHSLVETALQTITRRNKAHCSSLPRQSSLLLLSSSTTTSPTRNNSCGSSSPSSSLLHTTKRPLSTAAMPPPVLLEEDAVGFGSSVEKEEAAARRKPQGGGGGFGDYSQLRPLYVSATRQHVGKTTTSLALVSGLQKRVGKIGFIKPVGQHSLQMQEDDGTTVACDKDAVLVKQHFQLTHLKYQHMSPVLIPKGYTKDYVDGHITLEEQRSKLDVAFAAIHQASDVVLCEGTGHVAVGAIVDASNAQVASWLGARMVLVANGGLGNAMDELDLNKVYCDKYKVDIAGVIINKVKPSKYEQTQQYISKALQQKWGNVPLLGVIPDRPFLGCPALADLEKLFSSSKHASVVVSGRQHLYRHYTVHDINLVATSLEVFLTNIRTKDASRTLYVSHASRHEILLGFCMEAQARESRGQTWEAALVVTGCADHPPSQHVLEMLESHPNSPPVLLAPPSTATVMEALHHFTPKLNYADGHRVDTAIHHYEDYINFDLLLERLQDNTANNNNNNNNNTNNQVTL